MEIAILVWAIGSVVCLFIVVDGYPLNEKALAFIFFWPIVLIVKALKGLWEIVRE